MSTQTDDAKENIKFYLDGKAFVVKKFNKNSSLLFAREELTFKKKLEFNFIMKDGFQIEKDEEWEFSLVDILDGDKVYLKSLQKVLSEDKTVDTPIEKNKKIVEESNNENSQNNINDKPPAETPISNRGSEGRNNIDKNIYNLNNKIVDESNKTHLEKKENQTPIEGITELAKVKVYINGNYQFDYDFDKNWTLSKARNKLLNQIKNDFLFLLPDGFIINHEEEDIFTIEGILNGDKIYINQEKIIMEMNKKNIKKSSQSTYIKKIIKSILKKILILM